MEKAATTTSRAYLIKLVRWGTCFGLFSFAKFLWQFDSEIWMLGKSRLRRVTVIRIEGCGWGFLCHLPLGVTLFLTPAYHSHFECELRPGENQKNDHQIIQTCTSLRPAPLSSNAGIPDARTYLERVNAKNVPIQDESTPTPLRPQDFIN